MCSIVCLEFEPIVPRIACGFGFDTSEDTRCLYNLEIYGNIIGCRSLQHLQNCGKFALINSTPLILSDRITS